MKTDKRTRQFQLTLFAVLLLSLCIDCSMRQKAEKPTALNRNDGVSTSDPLSVHDRAIVIDMHADTTQRLLDEKVNLSERLADGHFDTVRAKEGRLDAQFFSIWVEPQLFGGNGPRAIKRADDQIATIRALVKAHPESWQLATSAADIRRTASEGKLAALMGLEGGYAIDERVENVDRYF